MRVIISYVKKMGWKERKLYVALFAVIDEIKCFKSVKYLNNSMLLLIVSYFDVNFRNCRALQSWVMHDVIIIQSARRNN